MIMHTDTQKITAHIPVELLNKAQAVTSKGITETIKIGLEQISRQGAYRNIRNMRGKYQFDIDIAELRKDKDEL